MWSGVEDYDKKQLQIAIFELAVRVRSSTARADLAEDGRVEGKKLAKERGCPLTEGIYLMCAGWKRKTQSGESPFHE